MSDFTDLNSILKSQLFFSNASAEEEVFHQKDLIQLVPFGISLTSDMARPFLLLKDKDQIHTLPVAVSPLEAGITLGQNHNQSLLATPHRFTQYLLESLSIKAVQAVFVEIKGVHQYLRIYLSGHAGVNSLKMRADEAMSLCLHLGVPIFATLPFINQSKLLNAQIDGLTEGLLKNQKILTKNHSQFH
ncbi:MAG: hypothetical protein AABY64_14580 [Bdellovibrionota bacterium]